ncbi:MAG TPA: EAL domain-containing protein [Bryobacteraceae bacterium]|jgi:diguanylate cyclase (GGDEF)-like protein
MWTSLAGWLSVAVAAAGAISALLFRIYRSRRAAAQSLLRTNQELQHTQLLSRHRTAILEMIGAHAPLSTSLSAVAELAGHTHPGSACAIWIASGNHFLYQVSAGLPPKLNDLVRSLPMNGSPLPPELAEATVQDGLHSVTADLRNAAGDSIGLLALFLPPGAGIAVANPTLCQLAALAIENNLLYERLAFQAQHDLLTGLPNRLLFQDRLQQAIPIARRNSHRLAVLWVDVDRFKHINDTLGHCAGDELLCEVARRLERSIRDSDTAARVGGDEFVVLANDLNETSGAAVVAQRIVEALREPVPVCGQPVKTSVSVGFSLYPDHGTEPATLMRNADMAMFRAKRAGRDIHQMFLPQFGDSQSRRIDVEQELRTALARGEFHLHYQPLVGRNREIESLEALLRWDNARLGSVSPGEFIPIAEEAGLIGAMGCWVAREACRQASEWRAAGLNVPRIAINASGLQLVDPGFSAMIRAALEDFAFPAEKLEIEVTETALVDNLERALTQILDLRELGINFAIDDFGTGYSSLNQLRTLPVDFVKIDRSFIKDLTVTSSDTATLVRGIIGLAHDLHLQVVAEGVETQQQLSLLWSLGCDLIQGFYLYRPLTASAVEELLRVPAGPRKATLEVLELTLSG